MAGIGALLRAGRGIHDAAELDKKIVYLQHLAGHDAIALIPEQMRPCAELRLKIAQGFGSNSHDGYQGDITADFEKIRLAGLEKVMEQASEETVTRDEMIMLVHSFEQYSTSAAADIEALGAEIDSHSEKSRVLYVEMSGKLARHHSALEALEKTIMGQTDDLVKLEKTILGKFAGHQVTIKTLEKTITRQSADLVKVESCLAGIEISRRKLQYCLGVIIGLLIIQSAAIIYVILK